MPQHLPKGLLHLFWTLTKYMFNTINIHFKSQQHTAGQLAECLLFYDQVNLVASIVDMAKLIATIGFDELVELSHYGLRIITPDFTLGILPFPDPHNPYEVRVNPFSLQNEDLAHRYLSKSIHTALHVSGSELDSRIAQLRDVTTLYSLDRDITKQIHQEALSPFATRLLYNELESKGAGHLLLNGTLHYQFCGNDESLKLETNINESLVAKEIERLQVKSILDHNRFLLNLATSMVFLHQSAYYDGEMMTATSEERTISLKLNSLKEIVKNGMHDIQLVQQLANPEYHSIAATLDQGRKTFRELIQLLGKAQKFQEWKQSIPDEANFITEYSKAVAIESKWTDNVFVKSGRWLTTSIIGAIPLVGTIAGPAASAIDTFLIDKIMKKWTPNQFLQCDVREFVKQ